MTLMESPVRGHSTTRRTVRAAAIAAVVVCIVMAHQLWWSKPTAFGDSNTGEYRPALTVNQTFSYDMFTTGQADDVWLHSAKPVTVKNTAEATVDFIVCRHKTEARVGGFVGPMDRYCSKISPLEGYHLQKDRYMDESIIMSVTPRKAGAVHFDGMTVNYSRGWGHLRQTGNEHLNTAVLVSNVK